jgi:transposase
MQHIIEIPRNQLQFKSLEDTISQDNPVRFIEAFVENISIDKLGFTVQTIKSEGRQSFDSKVFLKIYLYGYLNGLRMSKKVREKMHSQFRIAVASIGHLR